MKTIRSVCFLCGCGCILSYTVDGGSILRVRPIVVSPEKGYEGCFKGFVAWKALEKNRITRPYVREESGDLRGVSWSEAFRKLRQVLMDYGNRSVAFIASGEVTNENNYVIQKFARTVVYTNNIDTCARLCHASTLKALTSTLGIPVMPHYIDDLLTADCILIFGSNPYTNYPSLGTKLILAKRRGARIISVQTAMNETSKRLADIVLTLEPGTEFVFVNSLTASLIRRGYVSLEKIRSFERSAEFLKEVLRFTSSLVQRICHVTLEEFDRVVEMIGCSERLAIMHGMGVTQTIAGTETVACLVNLALLKDAKLVSMRGKVNIQGAGDMGCSPHEYPTGPISEETRREYENLIGASVPGVEGLTLVEFLIRRPADVIYICGMNPAVSMPDLESVHRTLRRAFVVYHHPFWTKTAEYADLILPLPALIETEGTITNAEGLVRKVERVASFVPEAMEPLQVFGRLARELGYGRLFDHSSPFDVFREICLVQPRYRVLNPGDVWSTGSAYTDKTPRFKRLHVPRTFSITVRRSTVYPYMLLTTRSPYHFCTGDVTRNVEELVRHEAEALLYMKPCDVSDLGIRDGGLVEVFSKHGSIAIKVRGDGGVPVGIVVTRFHFENVLVNMLTPPDVDVESHTPNYKGYSREDSASTLMGVGWRGRSS